MTIKDEINEKLKLVVRNSSEKTK